ncbi:MAG: DMT family transporter [Inquilinaceae bacterium]
MTQPVDDKKSRTSPRRSALARLAARVYDAPYLLLTLTVLFWSGNVVLGRGIAEAVPPVGLAFWRWVGALAVVAVLAWRPLRRDWPQIVRHWRILALLAALGIAAFNTLVYAGLHSTQAINALLIQAAMPALIVLLSFLLFRERVTALQICGIVVALAGTVTIIARGDPAVLAGLRPSPGDLLILVAVLGYAGYSVLLRRRPALHPMSLLTVLFALGAAMLAPFYVAETAMGAPMRFDPVTLASVAYVAVFPSVLAYLCFNRGVELVGANRAGLFIYLMPLFGSAMAVLFLGESVRPFHAAGLVLIMAGIVLATRPPWSGRPTG